MWSVFWSPALRSCVELRGLQGEVSLARPPNLARLSCTAWITGGKDPAEVEARSLQCISSGIQPPVSAPGLSLPGCFRNQVRETCYANPEIQAVERPVAAACNVVCLNFQRGFLCRSIHGSSQCSWLLAPQKPLWSLPAVMMSCPLCGMNIHFLACTVSSSLAGSCLSLSHTLRVMMNRKIHGEWCWDTMLLRTL